jgi:hypothetical protein
MPTAIPSGAETVILPTVGEIFYFRDGSDWLAVWPDFQDFRTSPIGLGATPGEAVANLVAGGS